MKIIHIKKTANFWFVRERKVTTSWCWGVKRNYMNWKKHYCVEKNEAHQNSELLAAMRTGPYFDSPGLEGQKRPQSMEVGRGHMSPE